MAVSATDGALAGSADLIKKLQVLGALDNNNITRGAVRAGMNATKAIALTRIPVGHRIHKTYKGRTVAPGFGKRSLRVIVTSRTDSGNVAALLGVDPEAYYETQFLERGTSKIRATHWMSSSFYDSKDEQETGMVAYLQKRLTKIALTGTP